MARLELTDIDAAAALICEGAASLSGASRSNVDRVVSFQLEVTPDASRVLASFAAGELLTNARRFAGAQRSLRRVLKATP